MCVLCVSAGKAAGGYGCVEAAPGEGADGNDNKQQRNHERGAARQRWSDERIHRPPTRSRARRPPRRTLVDRHRGARVRQRGGRPGLVSRRSGRRAAVHLRAERLRQGRDPGPATCACSTPSGTQIAYDDDSGPLAGAKLTFTAIGDRHLLHLGRRLQQQHRPVHADHERRRRRRSRRSSRVQDAADFLTNTYWEINGSRDRHFGSSTITLQPRRARAGARSARPHRVPALVGRRQPHLRRDPWQRRTSRSTIRRRAPSRPPPSRPAA